MEPKSIFCVNVLVEVPEISRGIKHDKGLEIDSPGWSHASAVLKASQKSEEWEFSQVRKCNHPSLINYLLSTYVSAQFQYWVYSIK